MSANRSETSPPASAPKVLLTVPEACGEFGFETRELYRLIREHIIPCGAAVHLGREVRLHRELFEGWLAAGGTGSPPDGPGALPQSEVSDGQQ